MGKLFSLSYTQQGGFAKNALNLGNGGAYSTMLRSYWLLNISGSTAGMAGGSPQRGGLYLYNKWSRLHSSSAWGHCPLQQGA